MTAYVSVSTDAAPTYAVFAPLVARIWKDYGYTTIIHIDQSPKWQSQFGKLVLDELAAVGAIVVPIPVIPPLSLANTMRVSRHVAACQSRLKEEDFILTTDADMIPLNREFFRPIHEFVVLRALYNSWPCYHGEVPKLTIEDLVPGTFLFPTCYCGATVEIWRELFKQYPDDPVRSIRGIMGDLKEDWTDLDWTALSHAILTSKRSQGPLVTISEEGAWLKGELELVDPLTLPCLSMYRDMPRGMLRLGDQWMPGHGPAPPEAIDLIPARFASPTERPYWSFDVAAIYNPEEADWIRGYRRALEVALGAGGPALWA